ncbi:uncharacterized protein LOC110613352 [Manihot esculenta]|uniref:Remorin C-terminal domain-containing protein n=2 Tax=Manihot esculenta TaxID=3983 RepID=A0A2C9W2Q5_MANES|nr:uncharacterized protein LOC110613352 [Manihot esculenta]KAG8656561.1 hypothetical protein MANES_04G150700v8 [Manihot esculenta]OAY53276.1 hypothetical protein MANES_04G150700v8 [Manihot esculenta]
MDFASPKCFQAAPVFASTGDPALQSKDNRFADAFQDPLCKLNLKETSEFVKSFPMAGNMECRGFLEFPPQRRREGVHSMAQRRVEIPSTPGRPIINYSIGNHTKKSLPSKWEDAEKWLMSSSCHESPAHAFKPSPGSSKIQKQSDNFKHQMEEVAEKSRVTEEKVSKLVPSFQGSVSLERIAFSGVSSSSNVLLKDKFIDEEKPVLLNFRFSDQSKEGFLFRNSANEAMKGVGPEVFHEVEHRDIGTEMTPLGSSINSRCHTPIKSSSPARHNTPANRSGPLPLGTSGSTNSSIDISQLQACHLAKLQLGSQYDSITSNWSSREEEEEEISKSLRHFETGITCRKSVSDSRAAAWEEEEKTKCCLRYQGEEAKIQAWLNLQTAKAEAQTRKLEVKIQKMRSNLEEKLMKRMAIVHRKAEEWRATASQQHTEQMQRASEQTKKMMNGQFSGHTSCGCFPCSIYP